MGNTTYIHRFQALGRYVLLACTYSGFICFCFWMSILLRFDFAVPDEYWAGFRATLVWLLPLKLGALLLFGQFRTLLTFFSLSDAKRVLMAMGLSAFIAMGVWSLSDGNMVVPRGVILTDFVLSLTGLGSLRTAMRIYREQFVVSGGASGVKHKKVAIIGAGSAGSVLFREIQSKPGLGMDVVCFVDDDRSKVGGSLHGRKIAGTRADLPELIERLSISRVIIAMPTATPGVIRETVDILNRAGIEHDILPSVTQILHKQVSVSHLRHVQPEDLLGRKPVALDEHGISELIGGKTVLVTGGGGSIGSELCRQVASHGPAKLILVERSEPSLFLIEQELRASYPLLEITPLASSVTQQKRMEDIFRRYRPDIVFHAAAHKHVPLMESQPIEAVLNNVFGTFLVAKLAAEHGVEKFVLVSSDKAVNPTNVMGATKRLAELVISELQGTNHGTSFSAVRFGNVLGSSGSVIPIFRNQISAGGPIKVTHPDITRYFMSIPEAVGLVLQSAWQASEGGEVFVLDMGDPVKIVDLARQMIELSGFKPDEDIKIEFTGLRPGEKLFEEPIHENENVRRTTHPKILILTENGGAPKCPVIDDLNLLIENMDSPEPDKVKAWIAARVCEYQVWKD
ncbi:MAG: nucleoside-diphosphate sugar epimerase/dehydratase [Phycisphaerae bacterium]|jgi:FlaA1/EpsC-like NDP-sugar epimerase